MLCTIFMRAWRAHAPIRCGTRDRKLCYTVHNLTGGCAVLNTKIFDEISAKLNDLMTSSPAKDFEKNARALLAQGFAKLDLVTRKEFDVQTQLLSRTQEKLAALEARIATLEAQRK